MADTKISAFTSASALGGTEILGGVQAAANAGITPTQLKTFCNTLTSNSALSIPYPAIGMSYVTNPMAMASFTAMAAAGEKRAWIGQIFIAGRATGKVLSSGGGGSIGFAAGGTTFANAGTTLDVGIQALSTSAGPPVRPNDTFTVKKSLIGGTDTITSTAWNTKVMGTGTVTLNHGDFIAVVFDMTARGGADSVGIRGLASNTIYPTPAGQVFTAAAWAASLSAVSPAVIITFDDGTLGYFMNSVPCTVATVTETFKSGDAADERGIIFQVPWSCKIDGYFCTVGVTDGNSDFTIAIYTDPTGTPAVLSGSSLALLGENQDNAASERSRSFYLPAEVTLTKNTTYGLAIKATGSSNMRLTPFTVNAAGHMFPFGSTYQKITRSAGGAGAFTAVTTSAYMMGILISSFIA